MGRRAAGVGLIYGDAALLQSALVLLVNRTQTCPQKRWGRFLRDFRRAERFSFSNLKSVMRRFFAFFSSKWTVLAAWGVS